MGKMTPNEIKRPTEWAVNVLGTRENIDEERG